MLEGNKDIEEQGELELESEIENLRIENENLRNRYLEAERILEAAKKEKKESDAKITKLYYAAKSRKEHGKKLKRNIRILKEILLRTQDEAKQAKEGYRQREESIKKNNQHLQELVRRKSQSLVHAMQALDNSRLNFSPPKAMAEERKKDNEERDAELERLRTEVETLRKKLANQETEFAAKLEDQRKNFLKLYNIGSYDDVDPDTMRHSSAVSSPSSARGVCAPNQTKTVLNSASVPPGHLERTKTVEEERAELERGFDDEFNAAFT